MNDNFKLSQDKILNEDGWGLVGRGVQLHYVHYFSAKAGLQIVLAECVCARVFFSVQVVY